MDTETNEVGASTATEAAPQTTELERPVDTVPDAEVSAGETIPAAATEGGEEGSVQSDAIARQEAVEPAAPQAPVYAPELLERAKSYQMTEEEAKGHKSPEELDRFLTMLDRQVGLMALRSTGTAPPAGQQGPVAQPDATATLPKPAVEQAPPGQAPPAGEFKIELNPEEYDPALVKTIDGLNKHYAGRLAEVQQVLTKLVERVIESTSSSVQNDFDSYLNSMGEEYIEIVGKGGADELRESNKPAFDARAKIWEEFKILKTACQIRGQNVPAKTLFKRAAGLVLADKQAEIARRKVEKDVVKQRGQFLSKPSAKKATSLGDADPRDAAVQEVESLLKAAGID
jgi:hypothetical protein